MIIKKKSILTGEIHEQDIDITEEQYDDYIEGNGLIQQIMPDVSREDREFLISGITSEEWTKEFG